MKPSHALAHIRHLSCLGLGGEMVIPRMLDTLHELVPSAVNAFIWTNAEGLPVNMYAPVVEFSPLDYFVNAYHLFQRPGELSIEALATGPLLTGNMERWCRSGRLERTVAYNEVFRVHRVTQSLDLVVRAGGKPRGLLLVNRAPADRKFTPAEQRLLGSLAPHFLHALDAPRAANDADFAATEHEAILLCDPSGRVLAHGPGAAQMLVHSAHARVAPNGRESAVLDTLPAIARILCRNLGKIRDGVAADAPIARVATPWGAFTFQAHPLTQSGQRKDALVTIVIRREEARSLKILNRLKELPLSARQRQVALMIGLGRPPQAIQTELGISRGTYRRYVENIHGRLEVHNRAQLMVALGA